MTRQAKRELLIGIFAPFVTYSMDQIRMVNAESGQTNSVLVCAVVCALHVHAYHCREPSAYRPHPEQPRMELAVN